MNKFEGFGTGTGVFKVVYAYDKDGKEVLDRISIASSSAAGAVKEITTLLANTGGKARMISVTKLIPL